MARYEDLSHYDLVMRFHEIGKKIRTRQLDLGKGQYSLSLGQGVLQALHCGYKRISAVELGVAGGNGLLDLCKAAAYYRDECGIEIDVWGIDNATGLPPIADYRDHPEIWQKGQYLMPDPEELRRKLPSFARLLIGDVADTLATFAHESYGSRLAFVSIDLDYYSSTTRALPIFTRGAENYLPAVPVYADDTEMLITYNSWCGEEAAIKEFNQKHDFRKIERNNHFNIQNFYVCHVLDHPIRTGKVPPKFPFEIRPF